MDDSFQEQQIKLTRKYLKCKIMQDNLTFRGHDQEKQHLYDLMKRTIVNGEAHSAFVIGPAGCGKTTLINAALSELSQEVDLEDNAVIVKLNGLLHHDDKVALKRITAQMQLENVVGDKVFGSFAANLSFLLSCMKTGMDRKCKSMVFVLDELDMFCHAGLGQTLLYNLFDITHNKVAPICVIGITRSVNITELLEKRVKSRYSNRNIFLYPLNSVTESPVESTTKLFVQLLSLPSVKKDKQILSVPDEVLFNFHVNLTEFKELCPDFVKLWNEHVGELFRDCKVSDAVEKLCYFTNDEQIFRNVLYQLVSRLSVDKPYIDVASVVTTIDKTVEADDTVLLLQSLSILELSLVIAMKHGLEIFDGQPMNFEMILHRYTKFANTNSSSQTVPRPVILKAFEHLQSLKIIAPIRNDDGQATCSKVQKEYQLYTLCLPLDDVDRAVKGFRALPTEISHWYSGSVI